jgi:nucleoside-diphosphate-sugar epimerase
MNRGSLANLAEVEDHEGLTVHNIDLLYTDNLESIFSGHNKIYHLAARIGGVGFLRDHPATIMAENDALNRRVFEASVHADVDRLLYASSSMLYAEAEYFPTDETVVEEIPPPRGSYGFQKLNGEYYCDAFHREHGLEYVSARIFNAVGPRDWPEESVGYGHVVPDMIKKIVDLEQDPVTVRGSGHQTRCFTDVRDTVRGLQQCMESEETANQAVNISTTHETSISELIEVIWEVAGLPGSPSIEAQSGFENDVQRRVPDTSRARGLLSWKPEFSLRDSIKWYLQEYKSR